MRVIEITILIKSFQDFDQDVEMESSIVDVNGVGVGRGKLS
jgi:hypothetical protein